MNLFSVSAVAKFNLPSVHFTAIFLYQTFHIVDLKTVQLCHPHGKYLLFKLAVQHLILYYVEILLACLTTTLVSD